MKMYFSVFAVVLAVVLVWRNFIRKDEDRRKVKAGAKELAIAVGTAAVVSTALFFILFNNTLKLL